MTVLGQPLVTTSAPTFDAAAAEVAARQLELTAQSIVEVLEMLESDLPKVCEGWEGPHAGRFDAAASRVLVNGQFWSKLLSELAAAVRARAFEVAASARARDKLQSQSYAEQGLIAPLPVVAPTRSMPGLRGHRAESR